MTKDAYISYTHSFFKTWAPVYDLFGLFILPVYRRTVVALGEIDGSSVLDVCTGTGEIAIALAKRGAKVTAVDVTPFMIDRARKKAAGLEIDFVDADARDLDFEDNSFDKAVISLGLHDMPRPVRLQVLQEMARVTKDKIIVAEYDFSNDSLYNRFMQKVISWFETSYFVRFSKEGARGLLEEADIGEITVLPVPFFCFSVFVIDLTKSE